MKRFFFDVSFKTHVQYDYQGRDFAQAEQARELAELIALDLECRDDRDFPGSESRSATSAAPACSRFRSASPNPSPPDPARDRAGGLPLQSR